MADQPTLFQKKLTGELGPVDLIVWGARLLRAIRLQSWVRAVRSRAAVSILLRLHTEVIHCMRDLALRMEEWDHHQIETAQLAGRVCTACNNLMSDLLELDGHHLHTCLKVMLAGGSLADDVVETWIRSEPYDARTEEQDADRHRVCENSVWSALLGQDDGNFRWLIPYCSFACNDLFKHGEDYRNSRPNWRRYYRSTLVFPLRYTAFVDGKRQFTIMGFLAFDSPRQDAFSALPDIFDYRSKSDKKADYVSLLHANAAFQLGATMADTLSMFLRSAYEQNATKGKS